MNCANHPDRERSAFCQNCGKPLCEECIRRIGTSVFCEPCFALRNSGAAVPPSVGGYVAPPSPAGANPGLAALLGFIPGVGAMYNGQYAKGVVHLIVFALLVSLSDENGVFGIFIAGWVFYMVIEAYHTARARRDGTPLPNPFGLNDLAERLGFGRAWPGHGPGVPPPGAPPVPDPSATGPNPYSYNPYAPPVTHWGAPQESYGAQPVPPVTEVPLPPAPDPTLAGSRKIPTGAIWLIGLGVLFLLGNTGLFWMRGRFVGPLLLIAAGVWVFVRRMTEDGLGMENDGTALYGWRVARAARNSVWLVAAGFLWLLDVLRVLPWDRSWPLLLIIGGVMLVLRRTVSGGYPGPIHGYPPYPGAPVPPGAPPRSSDTAIVPAAESRTGEER